MQSATVLTCRKPVQRNRYGEIPEGLPGSESVACSERGVRNLGGPSASSALPSGGRAVQPKEGCPMGKGSEGSQIISYYSETVTPVTWGRG
jgi:hypothetical protein